MSDEDVDRSILEAEAEVLPERELMSLISPDTGFGTVPADAAGSAGGAESGPDDDRSEQISQSDSASAGT